MGFADVGFMRYSLVADHYQHLALIGVVALVAAGFEYWRGAKALSLAPQIAAGTAIAVLSALSWQQASLFAGPIKLYSSVLAKNPECPMAHYNLANSLFQNHEIPRAIGHYELALRLDANYPGARKFGCSTDERRPAGRSDRSLPAGDSTQAGRLRRDSEPGAGICRREAAGGCDQRRRKRHCNWPKRMEKQRWPSRSRIG